MLWNSVIFCETTAKLCNLNKSCQNLETVTKLFFYIFLKLGNYCDIWEENLPPALWLSGKQLWLKKLRLLMQKLWWHRSVRGRVCDAINKSWRRAFWRYPSRQLRRQLQAITKQNTGERKGRRQNLLSGTYRTKQSLDTIGSRATVLRRSLLSRRMMTSSLTSHYSGALIKMFCVNSKLVRTIFWAQGLGLKPSLSSSPL